MKVKFAHLAFIPLTWTTVVLWCFIEAVWWQQGEMILLTHKKKKKRQQDALSSSATSVGANWTFLKKTRQQGHLVAVWRQADIRALRFQWCDSSSERHSWRFNDQIKGATWHFNICELLTVKRHNRLWKDFRSFFSCTFWATVLEENLKRFTAQNTTLIFFHKNELWNVYFHYLLICRLFSWLNNYLISV